MEQAIVISGGFEQSLSAGDLVGKWLENLDVMPITKRQYASSIQPFIRFIAHNRIACRADMLTFRASLSALSASAVNLCLTACRSFAAYIAEIFPTPAAASLLSIIKAVKSVKRSGSACRQALSKEQAAAVCSAGAESLRDRALISLMTSCGLRCCEVSRADAGDVKQIGGKTCLYVQGKGRAEKDRFVVIPAAVASMIRQYLDGRQASAGDPLFCSVSNRCKGARLSAESVGDIAKKAIRRIGLEGKAYTAHSLRHTAVTLALKAGAALREVQAMARHENLNTTCIYAHDLQRFENSAEEKLYSYIFAAGAVGRKVARRFRCRA